ncbi:hypothetical protein T484DRAFT_1935195 [Baffinella frigidus]|nr:hypothetical protein T484DRAFT_1935195 [Cryptophyta sp. CCMP2293]
MSERMSKILPRFNPSSTPDNASRPSTRAIPTVPVSTRQVGSRWRFAGQPPSRESSTCPPPCGTLRGTGNFPPAHVSWVSQEDVSSVRCALCRRVTWLLVPQCGLC